MGPWPRRIFVVLSLALEHVVKPVFMSWDLQIGSTLLSIFNLQASLFDTVLG
jgi:hypothetical protein